jgi:hypothetical protein
VGRASTGMKIRFPCAAKRFAIRVALGELGEDPKPCRYITANLSFISIT